MQITLENTVRSAAEIADDYALLAAEEASVEARKKALKEEIANSGLRELVGTLHRLVVSPRAGRKTFDTKAAVEAGALTEEQAQKFTKTGAGFTVISVYGLK